MKKPTSKSSSSLVNPPLKPTSATLLEGIRRALSPEGQAAARAHLTTRGPRYGVDPENPSLLVRVDPDGTRTRGYVVDGKFVVVK